MLADCLAVLGACLITAGVALVSIPAALVIGGVLLIGVGWRFA